MNGILSAFRRGRRDDDEVLNYCRQQCDSGRCFVVNIEDKISYHCMNEGDFMLFSVRVVLVVAALAILQCAVIASLCVLWCCTMGRRAKANRYCK